ncbi:hypothetical protein GCM10009558_067880 [Virgisporangium aurantiacum]
MDRVDTVTGLPAASSSRIASGIWVGPACWKVSGDVRAVIPVRAVSSSACSTPRPPLPIVAYPPAGATILSGSGSAVGVTPFFRSASSHAWRCLRREARCLACHSLRRIRSHSWEVPMKAFSRIGPHAALLPGRA